MIDAVGLAFRQHRRHRLVDGTGGGEILTQRLFEHEARSTFEQTGRFQRAARRDEAIRRGRQIECTHTGRVIEALGEAGKALGIGDIGLHEFHDWQQAANIFIPHAMRAQFRAEMLLQRLRAVAAAHDSENAAPLGQNTLRRATRQRRKQLAQRKIPGRTHQNEIEKRNRRALGQDGETTFDHHGQFLQRQARRGLQGPS